MNAQIMDFTCIAALMFRILSFIPKYLRNIAGLPAKVKNYCRLRIGRHREMIDKPLLSRYYAILLAA
jgi:hypothetical protein